MKTNANLMSNSTARPRTLAWIVIAGVISLSPAAFAITRTWNGGVSGYWSDGGNWSPTGPPQAGDDLVFNNSPGVILTNDILGLSVRSLQFNHACALYSENNDLAVTSSINASSVDSAPLTMNLSTLTLGGDIIISANDTTGWGLILYCPVNLNGHNLTVSAGNDTGVGLFRRIFNYLPSGGRLTFTSGNNILLNPSDLANRNQFSGTVTVSGGTLSLGGTNQPVVPGNLIIGLGPSSSSPATVLFQEANCVGGNTVTINADSILNLQNHDLNIGQLNLNDGGQAITGAGTLWFSPGGQVNVGSHSPSGSHYGSSISGNIQIAPNDVITFTVASYAISPPDLDVSANISVFQEQGGNVSPASIIKEGRGQMQLSGANSYRGTTFVNDGTVIAASTTALGTSDYGTQVNNGASLAIDAGTNAGVTINNEALYLNSSNSMALDCRAGSNVWSGPVTLTQSAGVNVGSNLSGVYLQVPGSISGAGGITKSGTGTLQFAGNTTNTYSGLTTIAAGRVEAAKFNLTSIPGDVVIGDDSSSTTSAFLIIGRDQQVSPTANVNVHATGFFSMDSHPSVLTIAPTIATLAGSGVVFLDGTNTSFTVSNNAFCRFDGAIDGLGIFNKAGAGTLQLTGTNNLFGSMVVNSGTLQVDGYQPQLPIQNSAKLQGSGTVGAINMNASAAVTAPGDSPGILTCGNFTAGGPGAHGSLEIELNGLTAGTDYDQLRVVGAVNLSNLTLNASLNFASLPGDTFTIIRNDGTNPAQGIFTGLPQGAIFNMASQQFQISYTGGDGNDVVLTHSLPTLSATTAGGGIVLKSPDLASYPYNSAVTLTAIPFVGYAFTGWSGDASGTQNPLTITMNTTKTIAATFLSTVPDLIVDNTNATFTGAWTTDSGSVGSGFFAQDFRYASSSSSLSATATFRPNLPISGNYDVYVWYPFVSPTAQICSDTRYTVSSASDTNTVSIDEHHNPSSWVLIASNVKFSQGTNGFVQLSNQSSFTGKYVAADAVRWALSASQAIQPYVTGFSRNATSTTLTWLSTSNYVYRLQYKTNLQDPAWQDVSGDVTATNSTASKTDSALGSSQTRSYRIELLP